MATKLLGHKYIIHFKVFGPGYLTNKTVRHFFWHRGIMNQESL